MAGRRCGRDVRSLGGLVLREVVLLVDDDEVRILVEVHALAELERGTGRQERPLQGAVVAGALAGLLQHDQMIPVALGGQDVHARCTVVGTLRPGSEKLAEVVHVGGVHTLGREGREDEVHVLLQKEQPPLGRLAGIAREFYSTA